MRPSALLILLTTLMPCLALAQAAPAVSPGGDASAAPESAAGPARADWVETLRPHSVTISRHALLTDAGLIASLAATRSSDNRCAGGCMGTIGYESIVLNDNVRPNQAQSAYAGYFEATRAIGAGTTHGIEIDVDNRGETVAVSPADMFRSGATPGLWIGSGAGRSSALDASAAVGIIANGARWQKGIVFGRDSLARRADQKYEALSLDAHQAISLYGEDARIAGNIYATSGNGTPIDMEFSATGLSVAAAGAAVLSADRAGVVRPGSALKLPGVAFSDLPDCTAQTAGTLAFVNDAKDPIKQWHQRVTAGGGHIATFVSCGGAGWHAFSF